MHCVGLRQTKTMFMVLRKWFLIVRFDAGLKNHPDYLHPNFDAVKDPDLVDEKYLSSSHRIVRMQQSHTVQSVQCLHDHLVTCATSCSASTSRPIPCTTTQRCTLYQLLWEMVCSDLVV